MHSPTYTPHSRWAILLGKCSVLALAVALMAGPGTGSAQGLAEDDSGDGTVADNTDTDTAAEDTISLTCGVGNSVSGPPTQVGYVLVTSENGDVLADAVNVTLLIDHQKDKVTAVVPSAALSPISSQPDLVVVDIYSCGGVAKSGSSCQWGDEDAQMIASCLWGDAVNGDVVQPTFCLQQGDNSELQVIHESDEDVDYQLSAFWSSEKDKKDQEQTEEKLRKDLKESSEVNYDIRTASAISVGAGGSGSSFVVVKANDSFLNGDIYTASDANKESRLHTKANSKAALKFTGGQSPLRGAAMAAVWTESTSFLSGTLSGSQAQSVKVMRKILENHPLLRIPKKIKDALEKAKGITDKLLDFSGKFFIAAPLETTIQLHNKEEHSARSLAEIEAITDKDYNLSTSYRTSKSATEKTTKMVRVQDPSGIVYDDADYTNECEITHKVRSTAEGFGLAKGVFGGMTLGESWWYIVGYAVDQNGKYKFENRGNFLGGSDEDSDSPARAWEDLGKEVNDKVIPWLKAELAAGRYPSGKDIREQFQKVVPDIFKRSEPTFEFSKE